MNYKERYTPFPVGVNATITLRGDSLGGFLATTTGTITVVRISEDNVSSNIVTSHPVTAGVYVPLPFYLGRNGGTFTTAGGASGTVGA
jgi:hypothetical protein